MPSWNDADRIRQVQSPVIPIVGELVRANPGTISLGQGVVHYPPPSEAVRRMQESTAQADAHGYGPVAGIPELVEALRVKLEQENGIKSNQSCDVVVTAGGNMAFLVAVLAIADPGDEIILPSPFYFNHEMAVRIAGCHPVIVETDSSYQLRPEALKDAISRRTRAIVTVSPNNPTGAVYRPEALTVVNRLCRKHGIFHINDEAYEYFTYDGAAHLSSGSLDGADTHTISLFSFSKAYAMAGLRMGYMVIPSSLTEAVRKIQDTMLICPPIPNQHAALGALEAGSVYCKQHVKQLESVRTLVVEELLTLGDLVTVPEARGAFYVMIRIATNLTDLAIVRQLVEEFGVAVIPGSAFGATDGCYLRIAYGALEKETVAAAMDRLVNGLGRILAR